MNIQTIRERLLASTMIGGAALAAAVALPVASVLVAPTSAAAQDYTSGALSGTVIDSSGSPVGGATVSVTSNQGAVRTATSGVNGQFRLPALPIGTYRVDISQAGFEPQSQQVSVAPGGAAYEFTLYNEGAAGLEDIVVTARRVQSFNATDTGLTVDVQEFADRVPAGRSINAITLFTPGASLPDASINASSRRNQSLVSLSGTSAAESVYYINGLNVTDQRTFLGYAELPFEFIQTIETKTGGYQAEFGRGTGGVVNIVTRSGTNEWTGGISAYHTPNSLRSERGTAYQQGGNNSAGTEIYNQYAKSDFSEYTAYLGGPIWKDHVFFFGVYNGRDSEAEGARSRGFSYNRASGAITPGANLSQGISSYDDPRWGAKLDFVLNPNHRLEVTYFNDESTTVSQTRTFNATTGLMTAITDPIYTEAGGDIQTYQYTGVFTDWFTLSALYGRLNNSYLDYGDPIGLPGIYDYFRAGGTLAPGYITAGRQGGPYNLEGKDVRDTYRVDADFYFSLFGNHHVRLGYDQEDLESTAVSAYSGGALYNVYEDELEVVTFANSGLFTAEQSAFYIQDSWDITDNLSLQLGLRNDRYRYDNVDGNPYIDLADQWAPRIGFNWDPTGDGSSRVYGSMGDYYLPIATNTSIRASSGEIYTAEYFEITRDAAGNVVLGADGYPVRGASLQLDYLSPPGAPDPRSVTEADIEPMYEREFILGYEHRFNDGMFADWRAGVRYVNRDLKSAIEDTAIGDAIARYCIRTNNTTCVTADGDTPADGPSFSSVFPYVLINPGDGARVFIDLQGDPRSINGVANPAYNPQEIDLTAEDLNFDKVERTYEALEFTFERPFDGMWSLGGSYTLANSKGNYEGAVKSDIGQTDTSLTQDYDHSANQLGSYGYLPNHHRHTVKLFGSWAPTDWSSIGANFTAQSGRAYGCIGRVPLSVDQFAPQTGGPSGWYCPLGANNATIQTPRGSQGETDWVYQLDLNFNFDLLKRDNVGILSASIDVFNVFDADTATRVVEQGFIRNDASASAGPTNFAARSPYYAQPRSYQSPRQVRFGVRYRF